MKIGDIVKNPALDIPTPDFGGQVQYVPEPLTKAVRGIFVRTVSPEGTAYSKSVEESGDPSALVYLVDSYSEYRLGDLEVVK